MLACFLRPETLPRQLYESRLNSVMALGGTTLEGETEVEEVGQGNTVSALNSEAYPRWILPSWSYWPNAIVL